MRRLEGGAYLYKGPGGEVLVDLVVEEDRHYRRVSVVKGPLLGHMEVAGSLDDADDRARELSGEVNEEEGGSC